jgi:hypothetical protein
MKIIFILSHRAIQPPDVYLTLVFSSLGIFGMDFFIVLIRAGYRVARRKQRPGRVGKPHRVTKEESMDWFRTKYEGILL